MALKSGRRSKRHDLEHERLALSFKAMGGGLWDYDIDRDILFCNDRWYEIIGLDPGIVRIESIGAFKKYIHPEDVAMATEIDDGAISNLMAHDEFYRVEFRIVRPSGEIRWLRSVACLIQDRSTRNRRAIGCVTDITEFRIVGGNAGKATSRSKVRRPPKPIRSHGTDGELLTDKERECLRWVSAGKTARETAVILAKSPRTVEFHLRNAMQKLEAVNKVHAAAIAIRRNLL